MEKADKIRLIEDVVKSSKELSVAWERMRAVLGSPVDCQLGDATWKMFDKYVAVTASLVGDNADWVSWFIFDNDCGKKGLKVKVDGKEKAIKTANDLLLVIGG